MAATESPPLRTFEFYKPISKKAMSRFSASVLCETADTITIYFPNGRVRCICYIQDAFNATLVHPEKHFPRVVFWLNGSGQCTYIKQKYNATEIGHSVEYYDCSGQYTFRFMGFPKSHEMHKTKFDIRICCVDDAIRNLSKSNAAWSMPDHDDSFLSSCIIPGFEEAVSKK